MNEQQLAVRAICYLESLDKPLPEDSDTYFYAQNAIDYQALLTLNTRGAGATMAELKFMTRQKDVVVVRQSNGNVYFIIINKDGSIVKDQTELADDFWNIVSQGNYVHIGSKTNYTTLKKQLWNENHFKNKEHPYWYRAKCMHVIKETIEWHLKNHLIDQGAFEKLMEWFDTKYDAMPLDN